MVRSPRLSAPPLVRGAGGIDGEFYLQFNYTHLLIRQQIQECEEVIQRLEEE